MVLSEKLIKLRKDRKWSQEELAEKLGISRQAVSKWESAAALPDIDNLKKIARLYGVTSDYLLDDMCDGPDTSSEDGSLCSVGIGTAEEYADIRMKSAGKIALGVAICVSSPIILIILAGLSEYKGLLSENAAGGIGVIILLIMVASAVSIFIMYGLKLDKFSYLEKEDLSVDDKVRDFALSVRNDIAHSFRLCLIIGIALCILSPLPLFFTLIFTESDLYVMYAVGMLLAVVAIGTYLIVIAGIRNSIADILLEEGDYTPEKKHFKKRSSVFTGAFWPCVVALYLLLSFLTDEWRITWIVWPVAALIYSAVCSAVYGRNK